MTALIDPEAPLKFVMFPLAQNKISIRLENIGDKLDLAENTVYIKLEDYAKSIWTRVNGDLEFSGINIWETTLSGNQGYAEAKSAKTKWLTEEDGMEPPAPTYP